MKENCNECGDEIQGVDYHTTDRGLLCADCFQNGSSPGSAVAGGCAQAHQPLDHENHTKRCGCLEDGRYDGNDVLVCKNCHAAYDRWEVISFPGPKFKCYDCGFAVAYNAYNPPWDDGGKVLVRGVSA